MTAPYYGKRKPGSLTAAAPGDRLFFQFGSYNDSGDSEGIGGTLAVTDIEVIKDGVATVRATDSGYSLISDTGQVGDRVGLHRFSIQLFNTADDASFYAVGSWYQVFVDAITVDSKTVRFWCGSFEIDGAPADTGMVSNAVWNSLTASHTTDSTFGTLLTDIDTGIRDRLDELDTGMRSWVASDTGLRVLLAAADTGKIATAVWAGDTGLRDHIDNSDTGVKDAIADLDTGLRDLISDAKNELDTGIKDVLSDYDTGLRGILITTGVNVGRIFGDTGAAAHLKQFTDHLDASGQIDTGTGSSTSKLAVSATATLDTGAINNAIWNGVVSDHATDGTFGVKFDDMDTGIRTAISQVSATVDTGVVNNAVWNGLVASHTTDGTFGVKFDDIDTGIRTAISQISATVDTGVVNQAVWQANASRTITSLDVDTGLRDLIAELDTGLRDTLADYDTGIRAILAAQDTGKVATAVWAGDTGLRDHITNVDTGLTNIVNLIKFEVDTGIRQAITDADTGIRTAISQITATVDTGVVNQAVWQGNASRTITSLDVDTGLRDLIAELDTGLRDTLADYDTGIRAILAAADTGRIATAVWAGDTGLRDHIDNSDTGVKDVIADLDTGLRGILLTTGVIADVRRIQNDTGAAQHLKRMVDEFDTGRLPAEATATVDTGAVNNAVWNGVVSAHTTDGTFGVKFDDMDTGIRTAIAGIAAGSTDTGLVSNAVWNSVPSAHATDSTFGTLMTDIDTGIRDRLDELDTGMRSWVASDTGLRAILLLQDTGAVARAVWAGDTGLRDHIDNTDTGLRAVLALQDTGKIATAVWAGDTGIRAILALQDTGKVATAVWAGDTGLRDHIDNLDTGLHDTLADYDTGIRFILAAQDTGKVATAVWAGDTGLRDHIDNTDTGLRAFIDDLDTGIKNRFDDLAEDTGGVNINAIAGDTGAAAHLAQAYAAQATNSDTGLIANAAAIRNKTDSLTFTVAGQVDSNIQSVNDVTVTGTGVAGDEWGP